MLTLDRPITLETEPMPDDQRPVMVERPLTDVLNDFRGDMKDGFARIERGVDSANSALALKADKTDVVHLGVRVDALEVGFAAMKGWRAGALAIGGLLFGVICTLIAINYA